MLLELIPKGKGRALNPRNEAERLGRRPISGSLEASRSRSSFVTLLPCVSLAVARLSSFRLQAGKGTNLVSHSGLGLHWAIPTRLRPYAQHQPHTSFQVAACTCKRLVYFGPPAGTSTAIANNWTSAVDIQSYNYKSRSVEYVLHYAAATACPPHLSIV